VGGRGAVFFWAPTMKWGITAANINDFQRPVEGISYPQQLGTALLQQRKYCAAASTRSCTTFERDHVQKSLG
jgi:hypothetical protein